MPLHGVTGSGPPRGCDAVTGDRRAPYTPGLFGTKRHSKRWGGGWW